MSGGWRSRRRSPVAEVLIDPTRRTWTGPRAVGYVLMTIVIGDTIEAYPREVQSDK